MAILRNPPTAAGMQEAGGPPSTVTDFSQSAATPHEIQAAFVKGEMDEQGQLRHVTRNAKMRTAHSVHRGFDTVPLVATTTKLVYTTTSGGFDVVETGHGHSGLIYAKSSTTTERFKEENSL